VIEPSTQRSWSLGRFAVASGMTLALAFTAVACGGGDDDGSTEGAATTQAGAVATPAPDAGTAAPLDPAAQRGQEIARTQGCAGCHGANFDGGAGPSWIGLAGSQVMLADGTSVVADDAYLIRSIAEPNAQIVADYALQMPANSLTEAEIADVVAFIKTLSGGTTSDG
jgi:cytochrome c oxidase subunit 2